MSSRDVFSPKELADLRGFPDIGRDELVRYFTPTAAELTFLKAKRSPTTMLGVAIQLCTLPWLGFVPDEVTTAPPAAVQRLAARLGIAAEVLVGYGEREQTRTDHLRGVLTYLSWRTPDQQALKELDEFLLARAMEHDSPSLLFRLACEHLRTAKVVRPGPVKLLERAATARARAERETYLRVAHLLTETRRAELDALLVTDPETGTSRLRWLGGGPAATPLLEAVDVLRGDVGAKPATIGHGDSFVACDSRISLVVGSGAPGAVAVAGLTAG